MNELLQIRASAFPFTGHCAMVNGVMGLCASFHTTETRLFFFASSLLIIAMFTKALFGVNADEIRYTTT